MDCPKCSMVEYPREGIVKGRRRYLCHSCGYRYTVKQRSGTADNATKRHGLELYLERLWIRSIGRLLKFSNVAVLKWIRAFGAELDCIKNDRAVQVMELEEMQTYIGNKKLLLDMDCC